MATHGPRPAPTAEKLRRGITRPSRVNYAEPRPRSRPPTMPDDLDDVAKQVWALVMDEAPPGMILAIDGTLLRLYCESYSRYHQARSLYALTGPVIRSARRGRGEVVKNPVGQAVRDAADQVRMLARELGLSPAARAGLRITIADRRFDQQDLYELLGPPPRLAIVEGGK